MRRVEGEKWRERVCWKSGGGRTRLYSWPRVGLADEASLDAIPNAAGGEGRSRGYYTERGNSQVQVVQVADSNSSTLDLRLPGLSLSQLPYR
jgi:hypothetical protein